MKRHDFFIQACKANMPLKLWWLTTAFAVFDKDVLAVEDIEYAIRKVEGVYQYKLNNTWSEFEDTPKTGALYNTDEIIKVKANLIVNIKQDTDTKINRLIANCILFTSIFDDRIPYFNKPYQMSDVLDYISPTVVDDDIYEPGKTFSMTEYLRLCNRSNYITTLSTLFFVGSGPEMWEQPAWVIPYRNQLLEQYKNDLDKPETAAKIDAALVDRYMKEEFVKGNSNKYITNKNKQIDNALKKLLLAYGAEYNLGNNSDKVMYISKSLCEGVDPKSLPALYNAQRAGSYGRGKETQEGGASVKEMMAATQNFTVEDKDCGSKTTVDTVVTDQNKSDMIGCNALVGGKLLKLTQDNVGSYLGKVLPMRSPLYCKAPYTSWCTTCLGDKLTINKDALPIASMSIASSLLLIKMQKIHSKGLKLVKLDLNEVLI